MYFDNHTLLISQIERFHFCRNSKRMHGQCNAMVWYEIAVVFCVTRRQKSYVSGESYVLMNVILL